MYLNYVTAQPTHVEEECYRVVFCFTYNLGLSAGIHQLAEKTFTRKQPKDSFWPLRNQHSWLTAHLTCTVCYFNWRKRQSVLPIRENPATIMFNTLLMTNLKVKTDYGFDICCQSTVYSAILPAGNCFQSQTDSCPTLFATLISHKLWLMLLSVVWSADSYFNVVFTSLWYLFLLLIHMEIRSKYVFFLFFALPVIYLSHKVLFLLTKPSKCNISCTGANKYFREVVLVKWHGHNEISSQSELKMYSVQMLWLH